MKIICICMLATCINKKLTVVKKDMEYVQCTVYAIKGILSPQTYFLIYERGMFGDHQNNMENFHIVLKNEFFSKKIVIVGTKKLRLGTNQAPKSSDSEQT